MYNRYIIMCIVWLHLFVAVASSGQILVRQDRNITGQWEFGNVRSPSAGDFGEKCQVKMISNALYKGSDYLSGLIDGCVADNDKKTRQAVFLTDATGHNGRIVLELGRSIELVEINTYSRHNSKGDQGARGPQVYTLYGTNVEQPGHYLATRGNIWKKIAEVDTRPNSTGVDWSGMYGVSISAAEGAIGPYRYLLWDISSTKSPLVKKDGRSQTFYVEFDVHTKETTGKTKAAKPYSKAIPTNLEEVIIVHKTHFDIGYTDLIDNVIHRYRTSMIDNALSVVNQSKGLPIEQRFVWTVAGWPMMKILEDWPGQTVQRKNAVHDAFKKGYFAVHAYAFTTHTESLDLEDMVRGFRYSSEISRVSGKRLPQAVKMTDVPSHSWILPTIFKNAGVNFLHLGCNAVSQSPSVPEIFMWQGPDGSELLTMYYPIDYGDSSLVPPKKWPYKTWLAMQMTGDNHGPPSPDKVRKLLQRAQAELPGNVKVRLGTLDDFGKAILAENAEIPVVRGDMPDSWIHGIMSMPQESAICRKKRPQIQTIESLNTLLVIEGATKKLNRDTVAAAYDFSLLFGEHTWGLASDYLKMWIYGNRWKAEKDKGKFAFNQKSWADKGAYAHKLKKVVDNGIKTETMTLVEAVNVEGKRIVVYNSLPWRRDGLVEMVWEGKSPGAVKDVGTGEITTVEATQNGIRFIAKNIPSMGYLSYSLVEKSKSQSNLRGSGRTIENSYFTVTLDPANGRVGSIMDKRSGKELVDNSGEYGFGQYLYERCGKERHEQYLKDYVKWDVNWGWEQIGKRHLPNIPYISTKSANMMLSISRGNVSISAVMTSQKANPHNHSVRVTLYDGQPYIDVRWEIANKEPNAYPEAGWLCLPLKIDNAQFRLGRLGGIIDPARDIVRNSNIDNFCLSWGLAAFGRDNSGIGLCSPDAPLVSIERPGMWRFSHDFMPRKAVIFVNLYSNQWGTNFQEWVGGSWSQSVRLWSFDKYDNEKALISPSVEVRTPVVAAYGDGAKGRLPRTMEGIKLSRKGVLVTAFGSNPDGDGLILRLWEQAGVDGKCLVTLPVSLKVKTVQPCNLRGQTIGKPISVANGSFEVKLKHNAPASFLICCKGPSTSKGLKKRD